MPKKQKEYFVYELIDPRTGAPFYVGKGKGARPAQHMREAAKGVNRHKCNKIREIQTAGFEVTVSIVRWFRSEDAAYRFEARHIKKLGADSLTNICPGGRGSGVSDPDLTEIDLIATCIRKTAGFTILPKMRLGGELHDIGGALASIGKGLIYKLVKKRGDQWVIDRLAKKSIVLQLVNSTT